MAGSLLWLPALCPLAIFLVLSTVRAVRLTPSTEAATQGTAVVDGAIPIAVTDENFICATLDWWPPEKCDYGTCAWGFASLLNLDLNTPVLLNAVKEFSPLKLRLGGTLQDKVIYETGYPQQPCRPFVTNSSELFGFSEGCLPMSRWDQLNEFFGKASAEVFFGLNALNGRVPMRDGSVGGPWDNSNAAALIRYSVSKRYTISGWELGNELSGSGIGTRIDVDQYAADLYSLKSIVTEIYKGHPVKPLLLAPGGLFDANWFSGLIYKTKASSSLDVITHHIYNLGPGNDEHLVDKILDPSYLDGKLSDFQSLRDILKGAGVSTRAWVGEAGGVYNSGRHLVSDAFVFSFWYLDQLGISSIYDTKTYCRQSLIGGNYGLLSSNTFKPNPDYYSALLWHRLMGRKVLSTTFYGTRKIRAYAHCARDSKGITLLLLNLDRSTTTEVRVGSKVSQTRPSQPQNGESREEYHLTAKDGNLHSQAMLLNGKALEVDAHGSIPVLEHVNVDGSQPIRVNPLSIVFAHIPYFDAPACL